MFERLAFLQSETVRFGNNGDDIDDLTKFFHHSHVYGAERMASRVDKVQAAVDARVLDVTVTHRRKLLAKVRAVLVLDILHNWVPASNINSSSYQYPLPRNGNRNVWRTSFRCSPGHRNQEYRRC